MATKKKIPRGPAPGNDVAHPSSMERLAAVLVSDDFTSAAALVADETSTEDLRVGHDAIELIVGAIESGDREVLERLVDVRHVLLGRSNTKLEREARYVDCIKSLTRSARLQGWENEARQHLPSFSLRKLLVFHDPAFAKLNDADVRAMLEDVPNRAHSGAPGYMHAAALLAVRAGAFNLGRRTHAREIEARALDRAMNELKKACKPSRQ